MEEHYVGEVDGSETRDSARRNSFVDSFDKLGKRDELEHLADKYKNGEWKITYAMDEADMYGGNPRRSGRRLTEVHPDVKEDDPDPRQSAGGQSLSDMYDFDSFSPEAGSGGSDPRRSTERASRKSHGSEVVSRRSMHKRSEEPMLGVQGDRECDGQMVSMPPASDRQGPAITPESSPSPTAPQFSGTADQVGEAQARTSERKRPTAPCVRAMVANSHGEAAVGGLAASNRSDVPSSSSAASANPLTEKLVAGDKTQLSATPSPARQSTSVEEWVGTAMKPTQRSPAAGGNGLAAVEEDSVLSVSDFLGKTVPDYDIFKKPTVWRKAGAQTMTFSAPSNEGFAGSFMQAKPPSHSMTFSAPSSGARGGSFGVERGIGFRGSVLQSMESVYDSVTGFLDGPRRRPSR